MGLAAKILAVVNVLAAIAFLWLASLDYAVRRTWAFELQKQDFLLQGLPVDDKQQDADGQALTKLLGSHMSADLFSGVQGPQVKTQIDEVRRRHDELRQEIEQAADPAAKRQKLEEILIPLAHSAAERAQWRSQIRAAKEQDLGGDGPFLKSPDGTLEVAFRAALQGKPGDSGQELATDPRRDAIAHILFNVCREPKDFQRALVVVGLDAYAHEVNAQANLVAEMVPDVETDIANDRVDFATRDASLLHEIALDAGRLQAAKESLVKEELQLQQYEGLVTARKNDVAEVQKQIDQAKQATAVALKIQGNLENALMKAQAAVGRTQKENVRLERAIRARELGR